MKWPRHFQTILTDFLSQHPGWVATTFLLMMVNFPIELILLSYLSGRIFVSMAHMDRNYRRTIKLIVYFFLAYFVIEVSLVLRDNYDAYMIPELEREIRNRIIVLILEKNEIQFDHMAMGELVVRFLKAPVHSFYAYGIFSKFIFPFIFGLVLIGFYVVYLHRQLGLLYFALFSCYVIFFLYLCYMMIQITENKMRMEMAMFNQLEDTLANMQTIFTSNTVETERGRMDRIQQNFIGVFQDELQWNARYKITLSVVSLTSLMLLFVFTIHLYNKKQISEETLVSIVTLLLFMCRFLGYTSRRIMEGMMTIGSIMESNEFLEDLRRDTFQDGEMVDFIDRGAIRFEGATFRYRKDQPAVLEEFTLSIPAQSRWVLVGDSGSGKTTFIRLLLGFFQLERGRILVDEVDIATSRRSYLRGKIAYIHQSSRLFDRTVMENILYGCPSSVSEEDVEGFLRDNELLDMFLLLGSQGLKTRVGRGGENLSGGMRQIVLLLRCVFRDCPIVILDEATASIDVRHRRHAIVIIQKMMEERTVIAVSHDKEISDLFATELVFSATAPPRIRSHVDVHR